MQRIINSGGRIEREYGLGRQRVDLLVLWPLEPGQDEKSDWIWWQGSLQNKDLIYLLLSARANRRNPNRSFKNLFHESGDFQSMLT